MFKPCAFVTLLLAVCTWNPLIAQDAPAASFKVGIDLSQLWENPRSRGHLAGRFIAAMQLDWLIRIDGRETIRFLQSPAVDEAVVTRGTFHVDAKKNLRDV